MCAQRSRVSVRKRYILGAGESVDSWAGQLPPSGFSTAASEARVPLFSFRGALCQVGWPPRHSCVFSLQKVEAEEEKEFLSRPSVTHRLNLYERIQCPRDREGTCGSLNWSSHLSSDRSASGAVFSTFLILRPFNTGPPVVVTPNHKIILVATS